MPKLTKLIDSLRLKDIQGSKEYQDKAAIALQDLRISLLPPKKLPVSTNLIDFIIFI